MSCGSLSTKFVALSRAARLRREDALFENTHSSSPSSKLLKHRQNHERTSRAINNIYAGLAVALAECIPPTEYVFAAFVHQSGCVQCAVFGSYAVAAGWVQWHHGNALVDYVMVSMQPEIRQADPPQGLPSVRL